MSDKLFIIVVILGAIGSMNSGGLANLSEMAYGLMMFSLAMAGGVAVWATWEKNRVKQEI